MLKDKEEQKKFLEDNGQTIRLGRHRGGVDEQTGFDQRLPSLVAGFHLKAPEWASISGKHAIMPVGLFSSSEKHIFERTNRTYAVYFEYPFDKAD